MNKINFENLPSTATPLNASNLNLLQTNVENAINQLSESIMVTLSENQSNSGNSEIIVGFDTTSFNKGTTFTKQNDGGIKCNEECDIEINAVLRFGYSNTSTKETYIYKNSIKLVNTSLQQATANTQTISSYLLSVSANDVIYLKGKTTSGDASAFIHEGTYLSIKRIG